jgi:hypothetical protein
MKAGVLLQFHATVQRQGHTGKITTTDAVQSAREMPLADKAGAPIGSSNNPSGKAKQDTVPNVDIININPRPTGTSKEYLLRRLSRDFPQALDRIQAGELSTRKAAIEYGIIKVKTPMQIIMAEVGWINRICVECTSGFLFIRHRALSS